eukprot:TRINITY_DN70201_c0_g1_i1.p1 TRINITY_DN70201_c0_g1~~TRINITY_DN70201_c0_g1_i1.p1  ORF type:complete len:283 (+),score=92.77 TRINITY_DN70201_c0_g1_i1:85-849(+)
MPAAAVVVGATKDEVAAKVAALVASASAEAVAARGRFSVALSGGSLPSVLEKGLAQRDVDWGRWHVLFADERFVPLDHKDSNYNACDAALFSKTTIPRDQIYPVDVGASSVEEAAAQYVPKVRAACGSDGADVPQIDMLLLGMGPDGHTLSLFPGHPLVGDEASLVASISDSPKPPPQRITLMRKVCAAARAVVFVATGGEKAPALRRALAPEAGEDASQTPARVVTEAAQKCTWFVDQPAAEGLKGTPALAAM